MTPQLTKDTVGTKGFDTYSTSGTSSWTNRGYTLIQIVSDAVFTSLSSATGFASITYPAGLILRGQFINGQLASGTVNCYSE